MYSHGLEKIYAFENINPKSVKVVASTEKKPIEPELTDTPKTSQQLILELGPYYQEALPSFRLQEDIDSLGLSTFAAKVLQTKEIRTCQEACQFLIDGSHKGLGQSHIEEIEAKVLAFMGKNPFRLQKTVDWQSLVRIACKPLAPSMRFCLLSRYNLEELAGASSVEQQEIVRLNREQVAKIIDQAETLLVASQTSFIDAALQQITEAYVMPWLKYRHGFSTAEEVCERLSQISHTDISFYKCLEFLKLFGDPIKLTFVQEGIYAADVACMYDYMAVQECAASYFYHPHTSYPLATLYRFVTNALALQGQGFEEGFIEKVLKNSSRFVVHPNSTLTLGGIVA